MTQLHDLGVVEASLAMLDGSLSPVELMEALLSRAEAMEPALRVWVTLDRDLAVEEARARELGVRDGAVLGPIHGVPVGVKDIFFTRGMRTTACSPIYADFVPGHDSTAVERLADAGGVVMGKTVTTEWACMDPPPTRNPWNADRTPGGSSSGSAVGVAARIFPAALGSQTAGSVLRPAAYNGVVGLKPSFGLISRYGVFPAAWSLDTMGLFTRSVDDAALLLGVLAGHDPRDDVSVDAPPPGSAVTPAVRPPRIGVVGGFFEERCSREVAAHTREVVDRLARAGAEVVDASLPTDFDALLAAHRVIMTVEMAVVHQADFAARPGDFGPRVLDFIERGAATQATAYVQAQRTARRFRREAASVLGGVDVLLTPSTPAPAPDTGTTGDPMFQTPWTVAGVPAITLPSGLSAEGLPLGVQLASALLDETTLLTSARWCEEALDVSLTPPSAL